MADTTDVLAIPFPEGGDSFAASAVQSLAERVDEVPGIESLTTAEIGALGAALKPAGRVVYNSTTGKLQVSNGTSFTNIDAAALLLTGGTMSGAIAMGGAKVTGLGAATTNGDAVRYEQLAATDASVAALGTWTAWTPAVTASLSNPTTSVVTAECRYMQIGKTVIGKAQVTVSGSGSGDYRFPLPATPRSTATGARRIGTLQIDNNSYVQHYFLEQVNSQTYCQAIRIVGTSGVTATILQNGTVDQQAVQGGGTTTITWDFQYEAA